MYMYIRKIPVNIIIVSKKNFTCKCETYIHLKVLLVQVQVQVGQNWWVLEVVGVVSLVFDVFLEEDL